MSKIYKFYVEFSGEPTAGLNSFTDIVSIEIDSGDPGGVDGEFDEYIRECISEWFDGAGVEPLEKAEKRFKELDKLFEN